MNKSNTLKTKRLAPTFVGEVNEFLLNERNVIENRDTIYNTYQGYRIKPLAFSNI